MSSLDSKIRAKRFNLKKGQTVNLVIDYINGDKVTLEVIDCSMNGLRCRTSYNFPDGEKLHAGSIVSASKLVWNETEVSLGRLVFRRIFPMQDGICEVAFSTVDIRVPVTGNLSKLLDLDFDDLDTAHEFELNHDFFNLSHFIENEYVNSDLFDRLRKFDVFRSRWEKSNKYGYKNVRVASKGERINLNRIRKKDRRDYVVMGSNDYLGLGAHSEVVKAAKDALDVYGFGSTGSPVTTGTTDLHNQLCEQIAKIHRKEATLLFNSGYAANIGIISAVTAENDLVIADMLCHASIQDGMQMSRATSRFFKHNDMTHLENILQKERNNFNGCLIITEGVFSMDGDVAKLDSIFQLARKYNCRIMVDQAHCFGVLGPSGLGVCDKFNLLRETDIIMGTFSKICGGIGGFVTGSTELIEWIRSFSRAHIFSVSLPPSTVAAVSKSLEIFTSNKDLLIKLKQNISYFVENLNQLGFSINPDHESAVIPLVIGNEAKLGAMYQSLLDDGIFTIPIVYPAVSRKNCRFRFTVMATHSKSDLDYATACIEKAMLKVDLKPADLKKAS